VLPPHLKYIPLSLFPTLQVKFVEKCLYKENKATVRMAAFELLLQLLDSLESPEKEVVDLLAPSINLNTFAEGYTGTVQKGPWARVLEGRNPLLSSPFSFYLYHGGCST